MNDQPSTSAASESTVHVDDEQPWTDAYNEWAAPAEPSPLAGLYLKAAFGAGYQARDAEVSRLQAELRQANQARKALDEDWIERYSALLDDFTGINARNVELEQERTRLLAVVEAAWEYVGSWGVDRLAFTRIVEALDALDQSHAPVAAAEAQEQG